MGMYYICGYLLNQCNPLEADIDTRAAKKMAQNTFVLALDGDVDFAPDSVSTLIDSMSKGTDVGAVCGRIHPTGAGSWLSLQD